MSNALRAPLQGEVEFEHSRATFDVEDSQALVIANSAVNSDYCHMILETGELAATARPGQFFNIDCPATSHDRPYLRRPMSIYRASSFDRQVEFLYKVTGAGTRALSTLRPGGTIAILGPLGNGFTLHPSWKSIVVLGRGVGLATLAPLAEMAALEKTDVTAIVSARSRSLVMSVDRFAAAGATVEVVTDTDGSSDPRAIELMLVRLIELGKADAFFTCGSNRLLLLMKRIADAFKIPGQVAMEQQMACGLGMCFCCVRTFQGASGSEQRRVCIEGPIFELHEVPSW